MNTALDLSFLNEVWARVVGYEGLYDVSSFGRVRSCARQRFDGHHNIAERILLPDASRRYLAVTLSGHGNKIKRPVHRLVLEAFVGPCPSGMQACHNNGNRADNRSLNLRWDTAKANSADKVRHNTVPDCRGERSKHAKLTERKIRRAEKLRDSGVPQKRIARMFGVADSTLSQALNRRNWKCLGDARC